MSPGCSTSTRRPRRWCMESAATRAGSPGRSASAWQRRRAESKRARAARSSERAAAACVSAVRLHEADAVAERVDDLAFEAPILMLEAWPVVFVILGDQRLLEGLHPGHVA